MKSRPAPRVALVFDDGPVPGNGDLLLRALAEGGAKATFAWLGRNLASPPNLELARRALAAGHEAMNHSFAHANLKDLPDLAAIEAEVGGAQRVFREVLGVAPSFFWVPYGGGACDARTPPIAKAAGLRLLHLEAARIVSTGDWDPKVPAGEIRARATRDITDGAALIFHEWRKETAEVLPEILRDLREQGFRFLTVSRMLAPTPA
jgi:peptidoglycan/xylan/chitin deacetylase (PgdA/CDA1 family)